MSLKQQWSKAIECHQKGLFDQAEACYRAILTAQPQHTEANHMLGMVLHQSGQHEESRYWLERAIELAGDQPALLANTAKVFIEQDEIEQALGLLRRSLEQTPNHYGSLFNQGLALERKGNHLEALQSFQRALDVQADDHRLYLHVAAILGRMGRWQEHIDHLEQALALGADAPECLTGMAIAQQQLGEYDKALAAMDGLPKPALLNDQQRFQVAATWQQLQAWVDALEWFHAVLENDPTHTEAWLRRGLASAQLGLTAPAIEDYRQALAINPGYHEIHSNLVSLMQYDSRFSAEDVLQEHRAWAKNHAAAAPELKLSGSVSPGLEEKIVIGWISPRFDSGLMIRFLPSTLRALPENQFVHHFYGTRAEKSLPVEFQGLGTWHNISELRDTQLAKQFRRDGIDIAMDLCGHNPGNRLKALSARLAPVQICWLDYFSTTGVSTIDYWLSDPHMSPIGSESQFSETVLRLPHTRLCYTRSPYDVVTKQSNRAPGEIIFGSFNRLGKLVDPVVQLWTRIVQSSSGARLVLKAQEFKNPKVRQFTRRRFLDAGLAEDRLELRGPSPYKQLLTEYNDIDIALDPFPFTGYATTCDALWMGLPVVTMTGDTVVSRQGLSLLNNISKPQWVAEDGKHYESIAVELANTISQKGWDRNEARLVFEQSPVCDAASQGKALADLLLTTWREAQSAFQPETPPET